MEKDLRRFGIVPVVEIAYAQDAPFLAEALIEGGLPLAEVTFRTSSAAEAISLIANEFDGFTVAAGTLLNKMQVREAVDSGAQFGVSPGLRSEVVEYAQDLGLHFIPGVNTPSEIEMAMSLGCSLVKLFPAEAVNALELIPAFAGPYPDVSFMPTGGISTENIGKYLELKSVIACGGTWIAPRDSISARDVKAIAARARAACNLIETFYKSESEGKNQ